LLQIMHLYRVPAKLIVLQPRQLMPWCTASPSNRSRRVRTPLVPSQSGTPHPVRHIGQVTSSPLAIRLSAHIFMHLVCTLLPHALLQ